MAWIVLLSVIVVLAAICVIAPLRRLLVTRYVLAWFRAVLPPMSATEQEAIDAGDVWQEANLFRGNPKWTEFLANPKPTLTETEQKFLDNEVEELCQMLDDWKITHNDLDLPEKAWNYIKTAGFFGVHIPKEYGGLDFSSFASSTIVQKVSTKSLTAAVTVMVPNSLGPAELILNYGTQQQKEQYLHKLAKGIEVPCFGLTSPVAGSDAGSITDEGIVTRGDFNGQKNILGLRLTWSKRYITLAPIATVIGLAIKVKDPDHLLGDQENLGITVVLLPTDTPGVEIGLRHYPLNQPFMNGPTTGTNVFVPLDFVVGGAERIGHGWQMLVECLAAGRGISLPALGTATGKHCYAVCGAYAKLREQFGLSIGKFEGVATALARIGGYTYILDSMRTLTLGAIDQNHRPSVVTAICKYHMTEMARKIINDAMDIHGGRGIILGPRNYLARIYEGIPVSITVEGANILTRCLIIFGQGAIRCHPYVLSEMRAAMNPDRSKGLLEFDQAFSKHAVYAVSNFVKLTFHSLTCMLFCEAPKSNEWDKYYRRFSFFSIALACCTEMAMLTLGGNLKRKENLSARLGDILSYLYMASAVLKYYQDNGKQEEEKPYVQWALDYCLYNIQDSFEYLLINFPVKILAKPMQWLILPVWRKFRYPKDDLSLEISKHMMHPSALRDRFTQNCVPVEALELAWRKMIEIEPLQAKVDDAVKKKVIDKQLKPIDRISAAEKQQIITAQEAGILREFFAMQLDVLQVDKFTEAELKGNRS
jgi:alkylation response protein AidB-like acyl-CoA dehydrogenase